MVRPVINSTRINVVSREDAIEVIPDDPADLEEVAKAICYAAWQACGGTSGFGVLQDNPEATDDQVFQNITCQGDYPGREKRAEERSKDSSEPYYADYVFGRMMKLLFWIKDDRIIFKNFDPDPNYNGWCHIYPTVNELIDEGISRLL